MWLALLFLVAFEHERAAADKIAYWREPPYGACRYVQDVFGATPDAWQEQLLIQFVDPAVQRISLQACAGPGKTCGLAWCGWHFLTVQVPAESTPVEGPVPREIP